MSSSDVTEPSTPVRSAIVVASLVIAFGLECALAFRTASASFIALGIVVGSTLAVPFCARKLGVGAIPYAIACFLVLAVVLVYGVIHTLESPNWSFPHWDPHSRPGNDIYAGLLLEFPAALAAALVAMLALRSERVRAKFSRHATTWTGVHVVAPVFVAAVLAFTFVRGVHRPSPDLYLENLPVELRADPARGDVPSSWLAVTPLRAENQRAYLANVDELKVRIECYNPYCFMESAVEDRLEGPLSFARDSAHQIWIVRDMWGPVLFRNGVRCESLSIGTIIDSLSPPRWWMALGGAGIVASHVLRFLGALRAFRSVGTATWSALAVVILVTTNAPLIGWCLTCAIGRFVV